jgi:hypothetical protein
MMKKHLYSVRKILTKADIFLIILLLIFALSSFLMLKSSNDKSEVHIYHHNKLVRIMKLTDTLQTLSIDEHIVLEIKNKKIRLLSSNCRDQICVKQSWSSNFPIICVPNELMVVIKKAKQSQKLLITS